MRYYFHIFDGSVLHPDDVGNALPSVDYAKRMAEVVADELKNGGEFARSNLVVVADENDDISLCVWSVQNTQRFRWQWLGYLSD